MNTQLKKNHFYLYKLGLWILIIMEHSDTSRETNGVITKEVYGGPLNR